MSIDQLLTPEVKSLGKVFSDNGYALRIVGGAIRDFALGKVPKDIDFATDATPTIMQAILKDARWKTYPTGIEHGTISVMGSLDEPYEITTLRIDTDTDGRHATVQFTKDFKEDSMRRDFTFNSMSMDMEGHIYDYFNGQDDLENDQVVFVGDTATRIQEDYLRILRFFRFQGRMKNINFSAETLVTIMENAEGLQQISGERIWSELQKILVSEHAATLIALMKMTNVSKNTDIPTNYQGLDGCLSSDPVTRLVAISADNDALDALNRYNASANEVNLAKFLIMNDISIEDAEIEATNKVPVEFLTEMFLLKGDRPSSEHILNFEVPVFPVTGKDLLETGMKAGIEMGKELKAMKTKWQKSKFTMTKDQLLL